MQQLPHAILLFKNILWLPIVDKLKPQISTMALGAFYNLGPKDFSRLFPKLPLCELATPDRPIC